MIDDPMENLALAAQELLALYASTGIPPNFMEATFKLRNAVDAYTARCENQLRVLNVNLSTLKAARTLIVDLTNENETLRKQLTECGKDVVDSDKCEEHGKLRPCRHCLSDEERLRGVNGGTP